MKHISLSPRAGFILTMLASGIILLPSMIFQEMLAPGDHGRDLYAFAMSSNGGVPYRDYMWLYGPLMPYYFAGFFKLLGTNLQVVLFAETLLKLASAMTFFLIIRRLATPLWGFLATTFFLSFFPFFFHTYAHTGGILLILLVTLMLISYVHTLRPFYLTSALVAILLMNLVKLNMGVGLWIALLSCVFLIDKYSGVTLRARKSFYCLALIVLPGLTMLIYFLFIHDLADYVVKQCFPFTGNRGVFSFDLSQFISQMAVEGALFAKETWRNTVFVGVSLFGAVIFLVRFKKLEIASRKPLVLSLVSLLILVFFLLQEAYVTAAPYSYRSRWAFPVLLLIIFIMQAQAVKVLPRILRVAIIALLIIITVHQTHIKFRNLAANAVPTYFLNLQRGGIWIGNQPEFASTVQDTVAFLEKNLAKNEYFFALPYEVFYYYLLDKPSPTYQTIFFDFMAIPPEQERMTIQDLENKKVNWVVLSNRIISDEPGLGVFGETNSLLLREYLENNFGLAAEFGCWDCKAVWNLNHGIRILRRK